MVQVLGSLTSFRCHTWADGTLCQESRLEGVAHSDVEVGRASVLKIRVEDITQSVLVVTWAALLGADSWVVHAEGVVYDVPQCIVALNSEDTMTTTKEVVSE